MNSTTGTETLNLENARLMTILNAGHEKLDQLRDAIDSKSQIVEKLDAYPDQLVTELQQMLKQLDVSGAKEKAEKELEIVGREVAQQTEQQLEAQLKRRTQLHSMDTELQIQQDFLEREKEKERKCIERLHQILAQIDAHLMQMRERFGFEDTNS